ncbi:unnamed protein product [Rotaria socialis]|uniref:Uncharacterized protein n=2 Tax=Rotaria socialis TaxID=392032 RepID=A0A821B1Y4_9BILA|nr:unnamed protein product [Rotaria socialis]
MMDSDKTTTAASCEPAAVAMSDTAEQLEHMSRILEDVLLIWLDANLNQSKDDCKNSMKHLQRIVATIRTFTDTDQCVNFLTEIEDEKVFMVVSGALGPHIVPQIQACSQLHSIYIFSENQTIYEEWAKSIAKVKGVYSQIEPLCEALKIDRKNCDRGMISVSFNRIDPLFMYTQLLKEAFLEIDDDSKKSVKELANYCRAHGHITGGHIDKFEKEYSLHTPIWWYTAPYFVFSMINRGLRLMDVDIILKMGFFIRQLHRHKCCSKTMQTCCIYM